MRTSLRYDNIYLNARNNICESYAIYKRIDIKQRLSIKKRNVSNGLYELATDTVQWPFIYLDKTTFLIVSKTIISKFIIELIRLADLYLENYRRPIGLCNAESFKLIS